MGLGLIFIGCYSIYTMYFAQNIHIITTKPPTRNKADVDPAKKTDEQKNTYTVPPTHPRQLIIEKLGINANILPMKILSDTTLEAPKTAWDVGWYAQSALPGSGNGALLIDGHVNDALDQPGIFSNLTLLRPDDELTIERGDKQVFTYRIEKVEQKPTDQIDMNTLLHSAEADKEGVNLITCGGTYNNKRQTYNDRVLVYAVRR